MSVRAIAAQLARSPSTISRELRRNREPGGGYRASSAHAMAYHRASRPKPAKLAVNLALREKVEQDLQKKYSPEQITGRLLVEFPDDPEMRVSAETIYQSIYVQSRGALRRELAVCLRTGRALRRPSRKVGQRKNRIPNMINIAERPAEVEDRAVPGNWEGDLIIGKQNQTAIGTLVERQTGYAMLLHLPWMVTSTEQVRDALAAKIQTLPDSLRLSLTRDQGPENAPTGSTFRSTRASTSTSATRTRPGSGVRTRTSRPAAPDFPKGTDLSIHSASSSRLGRPGDYNDRPRKRLAFKKPIELIGDLLLR